jgi:CO/xanthine dehydrogenase Mo-binding subunit
MSAAPAILNAIDDAIGVRLFDLPASPEKVLKALQSKCQTAQKAAGA